MPRLAKPGDKKANYRFLDKLLGEMRRRKRFRKLLIYPQRVLKERAEILDKVFSNRKWTTYPLLLLLPPETVFRRARLLEKAFGEEWKNHPRLLHICEGRFIERLKLLTKLFDVPEEWFVRYFWFFTISDKKLLEAYHKVTAEREEAISYPLIVMKYIQKKRVPRTKQTWRFERNITKH